jgi:hypothetical protein
MKSQGYAPANEEHTRIPGIWKKLGTLYNLPALDERVRSTYFRQDLIIHYLITVLYRKTLLSQMLTDRTSPNTVRSNYRKMNSVI